MTRTAAVVLAVGAAVAVGIGGAAAAGAAGEPAVAVSAQAREVLSYDCRSELGRRDVTLFANGTVRLRQGLDADGERPLQLEELDREEMASLYGRLYEIADDDALGQRPLFGVDGRWTERCVLVLALPERPPERFELGSFESLPGRLGRLVQVAEDLVADMRPAEEPERLPPQYVPEVGDVLTDLAGHRYRVVRFTVGGTGVELDGIDQPLRRYLAVEQLPEAFVAVDVTSRRP